MGFRANETGKCPHCGVTVRFERVQVNTFSAEVYMIQTPSQFRAILHIAGCPHCGKPVLSISKLVTPQGTEEVLDSLVWPDIVVRPVPPEVEAEDPVVAADFREAVAVLPKSKKAAAALARRCLQHILREKAGTKAKIFQNRLKRFWGNCIATCCQPGCNSPGWQFCSTSDQINQYRRNCRGGSRGSRMVA